MPQYGIPQLSGGAIRRAVLYETSGTKYIMVATPFDQYLDNLTESEVEVYYLNQMDLSYSPYGALTYLDTIDSFMLGLPYLDLVDIRVVDNRVFILDNS